MCNHIKANFLNFSICISQHVQASHTPRTQIPPLTRTHTRTRARTHTHSRTHTRTHAHTHTHTHSLSYYTLEVRYNVFSRNAVPALIIIYIDTRSKIFPPRRRSNSNASCHKCQPNIQFATDERVLFAFILITCKQRTVYVARNNSLGAMLVNFLAPVASVR